MNGNKRSRAPLLVGIIIWALIGIFAISSLCYGAVFGWNKWYGFELFSGWNVHFGGGSTTLIQDESYSASGINAVELNTTSARIDVRYHDQDTINVRYYGYQDSQSCTITANGGKFHVRTPNTSRIFFFGFWTGDERIEITLPRSLEVDFSANSTSGDIVISENSKFLKAEFRTTFSEILLGDVVCYDFTAGTTSGDIQVRSVECEKYYLSSTSGDVTIRSLSGEGSAGTVSGDIELTLSKNLGNSRFSSTSGEIDLLVDRDLNFTAECDTTSGDVSAQGFTNVQEGKRHTTVIAAGVSGTPVELGVSTVSGDISFRS